jgi:hypothetical protein
MDTDEAASRIPLAGQKKGIKYSDALFCMFAKQLHVI